MTKQAYWRKRVGQWERSGQSQREFCAKRGLALSTFQWWRGKLQRAEAPGTAAPFVPLTLSAPVPAAAIEVELRSKTRLRLEGEAALRALETLVARIR